MKISFDPEANALYVTVKATRADDVGETEIAEDGVIIDYDSSGRPRGFEFLEASTGIPLDGIPAMIAEKIARFVAEGHLSGNVPVSVDY